MCIARCMTVYGALAYIRSRIACTASSHPGPSNEAPRISLLSPSTRMRIKPCVSPFFDGAGNARHRPLAGQHPAPAVACLGQGHANAAQWRVSVKGIGGDALADPARILVEQIRRDDLEIVVRGVGEGALAVAVTERPDARCGGLQLVIDDDVAMLVAAHPGFVEIEIVGIWPTADCQQQMRAGDFGGAGGAIDLGNDLVAAFGEADAFGIQPDLDTLALDDVLDRGRHVLVLMTNQPWRHFDDRYPAAKAAVHLAEF